MTITHITPREQALMARVAELEKDVARHVWFVNRVLACDYGDNDLPGKIGWCIRADLLGPIGRQPSFIFGKSITAAIDDAMLSNGE